MSLKTPKGGNQNP